MNKLISLAILMLALVATVQAHIGMLWPPVRGGVIPPYNKKAPGYNGRFSAFIGYRDSTYTVKFPCGGYPKGPVTKVQAGKVVNVRFYASDMKLSKWSWMIGKQPSKPSSRSSEISQARHGGGMCEFSLSYDGGRTYRLIGRYNRSCPDIYYYWPVKIPANAPPCTNYGNCLFVWSWTANILPQYYHNCADIRLTTTRTGSYTLPPKGIQIVDFGSYPKNIVAPGDGLNHNAGKGPSSTDVANNMKNAYRPLTSLTHA
jgi:hypothetical protein